MTSESLPKMIDPDKAKAGSRGISADMPPEAISNRLTIAAELFHLVEYLSRAKRIGPVEESTKEASD